MGPGGSQEATFDLQGSIPAGTWHCILDAVISAPCTVQFDLIWRRGATDTVLSTWTDDYTPILGNFDAQAVEYDRDGLEVVFESGDQLVFRYSAVNVPSAEAYYPNGDGPLKNGRIPSFALPK